MAILTAVQLKKEFVVRTLFSGVSFEIAPRDHVGLIGVNGCGKSTLLKMLLRQEPADDGYISVTAGTVIASIEQTPALEEGVTLFDFVLQAHGSLLDWEKELSELPERIHRAGTDRDRLIRRQADLTERFEREGGLTFRSRTRSALMGLGFSSQELEKSVTRFSGGQVAKAMLCRAILKKADLLLLDEPTNNLDVAAINYLQDFLSAYRGAFLLVSHDRAFLDAVTNRIFELENGHLIQTRGNYTRHMELKLSEREAAQRRYQRTMKEIKRIEGIIVQQKRWNQERNYVTIASKEKQIARLKETLVLPEKDPAQIHFHFRGPEPSGNEILSVRGLKKSFNGRTVFENVSFLIWKGQTVCLIGANGCGKSTLLKILVDKEQADDGIYTIGAGVRLGYFEQNLDGLNTDNTILEEMQDAFPRLLEGEIRNYLGAFLFRGDDIYKNIGNLSGGERARIKLLKLVLGGANVLLLDEPTNHFDIQSCEVLEKALESFEGTVLIVTHDRYLVRRMADRVLYLDRNGIQELEEQEGEDIFSLVKAPEPAQAQETTEKKQKENFYKQQKQSRIALAAARQQAARCEKAIMENELQCNQLQTDMETAQQRGEYSRIQEFCARLEQLQKESDCLYEKLEQAENELATLEEQMEQNG